MPLGIEQNNIAPQLIQNSGSALVQGIRQIGQQISGHLTEIQTKRDLGAMAQEMQGLNVQSNEFPVQLTQMLSRHPLAARDERGQMALSILGKAHGQWQAGEAEARAFNRAMAMQTRRTQDARENMDYQEGIRAKRPVTVAGVGLVAPNEIDPVTGQAKVLVPAAPKGSTALPFSSSPGGIYDRRTGQITAPLPEKPMNANQKFTAQRQLVQNQLSGLDKDLEQDQQDFNNTRKRYDALHAAEIKAMKDGQFETPASAQIRKEKEAAGKLADEIDRQRSEKVKKRQKLLEDLGALGSELDGAGAPAGEVLPQAGAVAAPQPSVEMIAVIDPNGRPGKVKASQLEAALQNGYKRR